MERYKYTESVLDQLGRLHGKILILFCKNYRTLSHNTDFIRFDIYEQQTACFMYLRLHMLIISPFIDQTFANLHHTLLFTICNMHPL